MEKIPFSSLEIRPQNRKKVIRRFSRLNFGIDTETYQGKVKLICDSFRRKFYPQSYGDLLEFLCYFQYRNKFGFFWNIKYDFESIVKWFPLDNVRELLEWGKTRIDGYHIQYLDGKYFEISRSKHKSRFYDMTNFLPMSLETASRKYLGKGKNDDVNSSLLNTDKNYWVSQREKIEKYCIQDSILTKELADWFWSLVNKTLDMKPNQPYSAGAYSQDYFLHKCHVPRIESIPREVLEYWYNAYYGGRFELLQRGYFEKVYIYDLKSAYPSIIIDLPDYTFGTWHYTDTFSPDYDRGVYKCIAWPEEDLISPIMCKTFGLNCYGNGGFLRYLTSWEIRFIKENKPKTPLTIIDGYYWEPDNQDAILHPFMKEIERLYAWKEQEKDDDVRYVVKLLLNSLSGKFQQTVGGRTGRLFNPCYSVECTARTRIKLLKAALLCGEQNIISFSTDSVATTKPFTPEETREDRLGDFVLDFDGEGVYILSDVYSAWNEERKKDRFRGMYISVEDSDGKVNNKRIKDILTDMKNNGNATMYHYLVTRPVHLREAYAQGKYLSVNLFTEREKHVNVNGDMKRKWPRDFTSAEEVLTTNQKSKPLTVLHEGLEF